MGRHSARVISSLGILEAVLLFNAPILSAPRNFGFDMEGVDFLKNNLGLQRFYTLGPILPNYGSAFGAAELNYDDMPVNKYLVRYFKDNLDPYMDATNTKPNWHRGGHPRNNQIIRTRFPAFGRVGVKYVVTNPAEDLNALMHLVYHSNVMKIYELPKFTPYFSGGGCEAPSTFRDEIEARRLRPATIARQESFTPSGKASIHELPKSDPDSSGGDCEVHATSRDEVEVRCLRPTTIVRLESFTPSWKASITGRPTEVSMYDGLFQSVEVPAGMSTVRFTYECPHGRWTVPLFWLGAMGFVAVGVRDLMARVPLGSRGSFVVVETITPR
jgi:hypothetical protein